MKPTRLLPWLLAVLIPAIVPAADGFVYMNVSVKFILHPDDGLRPRLESGNPATRITDAEINASVADANRFLASYGRGYRLRIVEMLEIGGINQSRSNQTKTQPGYYSIYYPYPESTTQFYYPAGYVNPDGEAKSTGPLIDVLDQNARSSAATKLAFKWNDNAVNVFVPSAWGGGGGISPEWGDAAGFGFFEGWLFLHELGHYYDLIHSFGDDEVADTLVDPNSVSMDAIATEFYGLLYKNCTDAQKATVDTEYYVRGRNSIAAANNTAPNDVLSASVWSQLPASEQQWVDDTFFNLMSYNDPPHRNTLVTRMTEGQADRLTDAANSSRHHTMSGYTRFVAITGWDDFLGITNSGTTSTFPIRHVAAAAARAGTTPGDDEILLLRPGNYDEKITISTPCTLRATRKGPAVIGKP